MNMKKIIYLRVAMAFIFLWAFLDKLFGLGFATSPEKAWLNGGSPTTGFLMNGTKGPFVEFFQSLAGMPVIDWLFMLGLLFIGITLLLNRFVKWGSIAGMALMALMYFAAFPPETNPLVDEHIIYFIVFAVLMKKQ